MTSPAVRPRVLDTAALLAAARGDTYALAVIGVVLNSGGQLVVPSCALAAAVADRPASEPRLLVLTEHPRVEVDDLTGPRARRVGRLLARANLGAELLPAAHVALVSADRDRCPVLAGDPESIRRVDPSLTVDEI